MLSNSSKKAISIIRLSLEDSPLLLTKLQNNPYNLLEKLKNIVIT